MSDFIRYTIKIISKWWIICLALIPSVSDFMSGYLPSNLNLNISPDLKLFTLLAGFLVANYSLWKEQNDLIKSKENEDKKPVNIDYAVSLKISENSSNSLRHEIKIIQSQLDFTNKEVADLQRILDIDKIPISEAEDYNLISESLFNYLERLKEYKEQLYILRKEIRKIQTAKTIQFEVKNTTNFDDKFLEITIELNHLRLEDLEKLSNRKIPKYILKPVYQSDPKLIILEETYRDELEKVRIDMLDFTTFENNDEIQSPNESEYLSFKEKKLFWNIEIVKPQKQYIGKKYIWFPKRDIESLDFEISSKKVNQKGKIELI